MSDIEGMLETGGALGVELAASALAERGQKPGKCPNCGSPMIGPYCAVCGQERDTHRRTVWALIHDLVIDIVSFDSRILRTARALLFQPGELPKAFREGRTRAYVPAIRLYLFVSLIFFLVLSMSGLAILQLEVVATPQKIIRDAHGNAFVVNPAYDPDDEDMKYVPKLLPISKEKANRPGTRFNYSTREHFFAPIGAYKSNISKAALDRLSNSDIDIDIGSAPKDKTAKQVKVSSSEMNWVAERMLGSFRRLIADPAALNGPLTTWIPRVLFLLLPLYAILLALFYIRQRKKFYLVDHLVFSLSVHTFAFVLLIAAAALAQVMAGGTLAFLFLAVMALYIFVAMKRFYEQGWVWTTLKFGLVSFIYCFFFLIPALGGILAVSFFYD